MRGRTRLRRSRHDLNADGTDCLDAIGADDALHTSKLFASAGRQLEHGKAVQLARHRKLTHTGIQQLAVYDAGECSINDDILPDHAVNRLMPQLGATLLLAYATLRKLTTLAIHDLGNDRDGVLPRLDLKLTEVKIFGRRAHAAKHEGITEDFHAINYSLSAAHATPITATMTNQYTQTCQRA